MHILHDADRNDQHHYEADGDCSHFLQNGVKVSSAQIYIGPQPPRLKTGNGPLELT